MPASAPVPKEYAQKFDKRQPSAYGDNQVSTGPYMIEADASGKLTGYTPGSEIKLVRNPNWDASTDYKPAYVDSITIKEGNEGHHTRVVSLHLRYGMIMFIASEVMFFLAWFWAFFSAALFPSGMEAVGGQWPPKGIEVLGASIVQMHLKNNRNPLMEEPGLVDWSKAWPAIRKSRFEGWFAFETPHASPEACIEETKKNIAWVMKNQG